MILSRGALALAVLLAAPSSVFAWGSVGHRVIARIAYDRLSAQARAGVDAAVGSGGLEEIAPCPDAIDHESGTIDCGPFRVPADASTKPWHYINLPVSDQIDASSLMGYCRGDRCIVAQIRKQGATAMSTTGKAQKVALMYLVHLIGDIHQPLHCASDGNDAGANSKYVLFEGKQVSLHTLWDHLLSAESWKDQAGRDHEPLVRELEQDLQKKDVSAWTSGDLAAQAAMESYGVAKDTIYPRYYDSTQKRRHHDPAVELDAQYRMDMEPILRERLERAGVRLAAVLERLFGPRPPQAKPMDFRLAAQAIQAALGESSAL